MRLKTIVNKCCHFKGFVTGNARFDEEGKSIIVELSARKNSKSMCSVCGTLAPGYDTLPTRLFEFIPFWGFHVYFEYAMRRVECPRCRAVIVEKVPWADGKNHLTDHFCQYLASWAKEISWKRTAERFRTSWETVRRAVANVVDYGLKHRDIENVTALGVDEIQWRNGQDYLTLVYQINQGCRRLLWVGKERSKDTLKAFFEEFSQLNKSFAERIEVICSDMWKPYLNVIADKIPRAINVLDRFHIMQKFGKAIDEVRAEESRRLKEKGKDPVLSKSRWCFLKRKGNLTEKQDFKLQELLQMNLRTVKAYLLKEQFHDFWDYSSPAWAGKFLDTWCRKTMYSKIDPMKKVAKMLRSHRELTLNYFRAKKQFNSGIVEGMNRKINLTVRKAFGFRSFEVIQIALYHQLGELPEPKFTHEFW
ncbi:MAG: ISL3 family transposase [Candidatus Paceibacterota bacterium]